MKKLSGVAEMFCGPLFITNDLSPAARGMFWKNKNLTSWSVPGLNILCQFLPRTFNSKCSGDDGKGVMI